MNYLATHVGCDDCGSSDALSVSVNDKGETWSHCFACGTNTKIDVDNFRQKHTKSAKVIPMLNGKYQSIPLRNLSRDALKAFGVMITDEGILMTKELLDELLYLIELQIKANIAIALGHADAADKEAEKEHVQYYRLVSLIDSTKDDLK